jgi:hypothetical protein
MDRPLFRSLHDCLRWAWYGSVDAANTVKVAVYAQWQSDDEREQIDGEAPPRRNSDVGGVPRGLLASGQAGAIKRRVLAMPGDEGAHVMVKFLRGRERVEARRILRRLVADYIGARGMDRRAVGLLLAWHYGAKGITISSVAEKLRMDRRRVSKLNNRTRITLDALAERAERRIYWDLQARGIVQ